jgi:periplasmic protein CpxP/Spy
MDYFSKNKLFISTIVVLVALNIATLATLWWIAGRDGAVPRVAGQPGPRAHEFLERELRLTDEQRARYEKLREAHAQTTRSLLEQLRIEKKALFDLVHADTVDDAEVERKAHAAAELQAAIDVATFRHFQDIRMMCTEQQRRTFDGVMNEVLRMLGAPPPPPMQGQNPPPGFPPPEMPPPR